MLAPILLQTAHPQKCMLQSLIDERFDQPPFTCALLQKHIQVCLQIDRYPALGTRFSDPVLWDRIEVLLPVFDHPEGLDITWHSYHVVSTVLRRGSPPTMDIARLACSRHGDTCWLTINLRPGRSRWLTMPPMTIAIWCGLSLQSCSQAAVGDCQFVVPSSARPICQIC